jgi:hypothetical protein
MRGGLSVLPWPHEPHDRDDRGQAHHPDGELLEVVHRALDPVVKDGQVVASIGATASGTRVDRTTAPDRMTARMATARRRKRSSDAGSM